MKKISTPKIRPRGLTDFPHNEEKDGCGRKNEAEPKGATYLKEKLAIEVEELRERFMFVIEMWAADRYRYDWLEKHTGIASARWQNVLLDKQFPTMEMLLVVCKNQPQYTYWLMTGIAWEISAPPSKKPFLYLMSPRDDLLNQFKIHREWIKQKRKLKAAAK